MRKDWAQRAIWRKQFSQEYLDNYSIKLFINQTLDDIQNLIHKPKPDYPVSFWAAFSSTPPPSTTTLRPWIHMNETEKQYLRAKSAALRKVYAELVKNEAEEQQLTADTPDWYFHTRQKRNIIHAFKLINDIVETFMGAFNAYEILQLKFNFNNLSSGQNMLLRVTQKHEKDNQKLAKSMQHIVDVIETLADYNPGLVNMLVTERTDKV